MPSCEQTLRPGVSIRAPAFLSTSPRVGAGHARTKKTITIDFADVVLRIALDVAVERELIESNPLLRIKRKRDTANIEAVEPFSEEEYKAF